eukprot:TRINITY_DN12099_c0_g1::TRINITY_DN12099_c0_g1_i1::g.9742::m.9742 TRINITY_DN12099_c0_g1::TRINITY_DN12099_c0_g1_i1::g.9742  ORF type:complete len:572 (+),score=131.15,sp/Q54XY4/SCAA_DICDI/25.10/9e-28,TMEM71/PF15121.1/0.055 TRINITY_DN12099_c0_g1_i1:281-1996(+)
MLVGSPDMDFMDDPSAAILRRGLTHRSVDVVSIFLFLAIHLIRTSDLDGSDIYSLRSSSVAFIRNLIRISKCKKPQTKYALSRLFSVMQSITVWRDFIFSAVEHENLLDEYLGVPPSTASPLDSDETLSYRIIKKFPEHFEVKTDPKKNSANKGAMPIAPKLSPRVPVPCVSSILLEFIRFLFNSETSAHHLRRLDHHAEFTLSTKALTLVAFVLARKTFHKMLQKLVREKPHHQGHLSIARFMMELAMYLNRNDRDIIQVVEGLGTKERDSKPGGRKIMLAISCKDLNDILSAISSAPDDAYEYKTCLLVCLRHLLKLPAAYEIIRKEQRFYDGVVAMCRDSGNLEFNRDAWRLFFQLVSYHPKQLDQLYDCLEKFFEILGTTRSSIVLINCLHYLNKLFLLATDTAPAPLEARHLPREALERKKTGPGAEVVRQYDKTVKFLVEFFQKKHLFVKCHMIFKRYHGIAKCTAAGTLITPCRRYGRPFQKLAQFYHTISTSPHCVRLYRDVQKEREYEYGLACLEALFQDTFQPPQPPPKAPAPAPTQSSGGAQVSEMKKQVAASIKKLFSR